jgi:hypothetical protein
MYPTPPHPTWDRGSKQYIIKLIILLYSCKTSTNTIINNSGQVSIIGKTKTGNTPCYFHSTLLIHSMIIAKIFGNSSSSMKDTIHCKKIKMYKLEAYYLWNLKGEPTFSTYLSFSNSMLSLVKIY